MLRLRCLLVVAIAVLASLPAIAENAVIAVATNFLPTAQEIRDLFHEEQEDRIKLVSGSTGQIYAQISQGAPFHAFLSADQTRVIRLIENESAIEKSRFTYAVGRLCFLLSSQFTQDDNPKQIYESLQFNRIAIANPKVAPYGQAAVEALEKLGWYTTKRKENLIIAENIGQTFAQIATGNAPAGLVALSSVTLKSVPKNRFYLIPVDNHESIRQDAVLLENGKNNSAAIAFLKFLKSDEAKDAIRKNGYSFD